MFVETVDENIRYFLKNRKNWAHVSVENMERDFFAFMSAAGLTGDRNTIEDALRKVTNVTKETHRRKNRAGNFFAYFSSRKLK